MESESKVTMKAIDVKDDNGNDIIREFSLDHAQRILDVRHPQKTWAICDENYKLEKGKIVPVN